MRLLLNILTIVASLFMIGAFNAEAQTRSVCDVLDHLSELNGQEVRIRGIWFNGDSAEFLWSAPDCDHPVIRDGWIWGNTISVGPDDMHHFINVEKEIEKLTHGRGPLKIIVTLTGRLETKEHFKFDRGPGVPRGYGYSAAGMVFTKAEDLEVVPYSQADIEQYEKMTRSPLPVRIKKKKPKK